MEFTSLPSSKELNTLDACVVIEETCGRIYRYFASVFSEHTDLMNIWKELAEEEDQHAEKFRLAVTTHGSGPECLVNDNYLIEAILANLDELMAKMKQTALQPRDAFLTAAILEHSIEKYHVETGKLLVNVDIAELLSTMAHNDRCHREMLQRMV